MDASNSPWRQGCLDNIAKIPGAVPCPVDVCQQAPGRDLLHRVCTCQPPYENGCAGNPVPGCCAYTAESPIVILRPDGDPCYCCCSELAGGALNAAADASTEKPVAAFHEGDTVYVASDGSLRRWETRPVAFSAGTGPIAGAAVRLRFRRGEDEASLVVHRDRPFLTAARVLRRAGDLVPGVDALVDREGGALPLAAVEEAEPQALHHLSTSRAPAGDAGGHLMLIDGVVAGDYALQLADLDAVGVAAAER